jgi:hypothetical protein
MLHRCDRDRERYPACAIQELDRSLTQDVADTHVVLVGEQPEILQEVRF